MSNELAEWRDKHLNTVSKSFCGAKWYNASLHLGHGYTNSCHLPLPHPIDLEEISNELLIYNFRHTHIQFKRISAIWSSLRSAPLKTGASVKVFNSRT